MIQTKFHKRNPWKNEPVNKPKFVPIEKLKITNDPFESPKATQQYKYDSLFSKLKHGQCMVMDDPKNGPRVAKALRSWLDRKGVEGAVKQNLRCDDGKARVWLVRAK